MYTSLKSIFVSVVRLIILSEDKVLFRMDTLAVTHLFTDFFGGYIQYFLDWDKTLKEHPTLPVLIVRYEDLKEVIWGYIYSVYSCDQGKTTKASFC